MRLRLERRPALSRFWALLAPLLAVALAAAGAALLFAVLGRDPLVCLYTLFLAPLADANGWSELALKATPLLLCAIGIAVGVRANVWNIGAEGQFTMGAIAGGWVALAIGPGGGWYVLPLVLLAGIAGGAAWGGIAAFLRTRFNAHEILVTLMLSYVAVQLLGWLVRGPLQDPEGFNFPQSPQFAASAMLPVLFEGSRVTIAALFALAAVPAAALLLGRTLAGYRLRVVGLAPGAARYAGFSEAAAVWTCLLLSGGLAGLAGVTEVTGPIGQLTPSISPGYGFAAIIVAFLGRLSPVGMLFASLLMGLLYLGAEALQIGQQLPLAAAGVIQGMVLLFLLGADVLTLYRVRLAGRTHA
jgi:simple sugar transport system permease protein